MQVRDRKKPMRKRVKRLLEKREPKLSENVKSAVFVRSETSSNATNNLLLDLASIKSPHATVYKKKNKIRPFEDFSSLEFFSQKLDASLFAITSHSKKRPNNLVLGRFFHHQVLDMVELGIENYVPITKNAKNQPALGSKPAFVFIGEEFENDSKYAKLQNIIVDLFRGEVIDKIDLTGLDNAIVCSIVNGVVHFRRYCTVLKKSGTKIPRVELVETGPSFDITLRRDNFASSTLMREALRKPKQLQPIKTKNVSKNAFAQSGRIHMQKQDLTKLVTHKMKGLKRKRSEAFSKQDN